MTYSAMFAATLMATVRDIIPIALIIVFFQAVVLRRPLNNPANLLWGFGFVVLGLTLFLMGLELALFPLGEEMANQLTAGANADQVQPWHTYYWTYLFAFAIGLSTTGRACIDCSGDEGRRSIWWYYPFCVVEVGSRTGGWYRCSLGNFPDYRRCSTTGKLLLWQ